MQTVIQKRVFLQQGKHTECTLSVYTTVGSSLVAATRTRALELGVEQTVRDYFHVGQAAHTGNQQQHKPHARPQADLCNNEKKI